MYSSKYVARLLLGLLLISVVVFDRAESGNVIGQNLPASIEARQAAISLAADLLVLGCGLGLCFSRTWRFARWPTIAGLALTLPVAVNSIRDVESMNVTKDVAWLWIMVCVVAIGSVAWATSGEWVLK